MANTGVRPEHNFDTILNEVTCPFFYLCNTSKTPDAEKKTSNLNQLKNIKHNQMVQDFVD